MHSTGQRKKWFADNLRREMFQGGVRNFKQLADRTGVDHQLLRRWGSLGISRIDKRNAVQLAKVADALQLPNADVLFAPSADAHRRAAIDRATNPVIEEVRQERPELFDAFNTPDWDELYSLHGAGGPLNRDGVVHFAERINVKREIRRRFEAVLETHHFRTVAAIIDVFYRDVELR